MTSSGTDSLKVTSVLRRGPIASLILGGILLIAAIAIGAAVTVTTFREQALRASERELQNTVLLLTRHLDQQLEDFEADQRDLIALVRSRGLKTSQDFAQKMAGPDIHQMLEVKTSTLSYIGDINIFDSNGALINTSTTWPTRSTGVAESSYFKTFKNSTQSPEVLVEQLVSPTFGNWATVVARKVTAPDGEFLGVISHEIASVNFEAFFAKVALGPHATITMLSRDGVLMARFPRAETMIGKNFRNGPAAQQKMFDLPGAVSRFTSPIDGLDRLIASRELAKFPVIIVASTTTAAALANWRAQMKILIAGAGVSTLAIAIFLFLIVRKLSRQHQLTQQRLMREKQRLDTAINNMTQGLILFDSSKRLVISNKRFIEMYGLSEDAVQPGRSFEEIVAERKAAGTLDIDIEAYISLVLRDVGRRHSRVITTPDGRFIQIVNEPLDDGGWVATHEDITESRRAEDRITHLAHYDMLTELPNRTLFHQRLKQELPDATDASQLAVLYLDIDKFKDINDSLGHMVGDELLRSVAKSLAGCVDEYGFVARLGGDEFAVVQTDVTPDSVSELVQRIYEAIRAPRDCLGHQVTTDASIGIALAPRDGCDLEEILKNADLAMYAAKGAGRHTWRFFEPEMDAQVRARRLLEMDLRQAIANREGLQVYYQPCLGLQTGEITGCEALVRWFHPQRGMIPPAEFIPVAEETGLINQLGEWVLATACAEAATWPNPINLAVNVSPVQFKSGTLALKVAASLAASGLPASRLELEITEAVLIRDDEVALDALHQLRAIGVRIALDDFGTGYSSLSYLQRFPFDKIKIDRCFVTDIAEPEGSAWIVRAVVNIAAEGEMTTIAEGVETVEQQEMLRRLGCSEMQGYLFSVPKPAVEIRELLRTHRPAAPAAGETRARPSKPVARSA